MLTLYITTILHIFRILRVPGNLSDHSRMSSATWRERW